jgi:hypothetical protein
MLPFKTFFVNTPAITAKSGLKTRGIVCACDTPFCIYYYNDFIVKRVSFNSFNEALTSRFKLLNIWCTICLVPTALQETFTT